MIRHMSACMVAAGLVPGLCAGAPRLTDRCNAFEDEDSIVVNAPRALRDAIAAAVADPSRDPVLADRLWYPRAARNIEFLFSPGIAVLTFDPAQDLTQIVSEIAADAYLRARGVESVAVIGLTCFEPPPPPSVTVVTEYHNRISNHYFLSSTADENAVIDSGGAGPGWERTGETFRTLTPNGCYASHRMYRLYAPSPGPNSHFFTPDPVECGMVRRPGTGWVLEGVAFGAFFASGAMCPSGSKPVYRLYNNRWMFNDSNHRYVTRIDLYQQMMAQGWAGEGVSFCVTTSW
jgi:hypothetical protein